MKPEAVVKINNMGKVAGIITLIAKILVGYVAVWEFLFEGRTEGDERKSHEGGRE